MPCSRLAATTCLATLIGSTAMSAQAPPSQSPRRAAVETAQLPMKPFWRLFKQTIEDKPLGPTPSLAPRQICGMKVWPADPQIDRRFEVPLRDTTTRFTILTVPVLCR
jgi:hypothetical protein